MAKKRHHGQGTIRLRKDGYWEGRVFIGYKENGYPKTKSVFAHTKLECQQKLDELMKTRGYINLRKKNEITFGEWIWYWYENFVKISVRPNTQALYESIINNHIVPNIGNIKLYELGVIDLQSFYDTQKDKGYIKSDISGKKELSKETLMKCHSLCKSSLEKAVEQGFIYKNPALDCKVPSASKTEKYILKPEEIKKLMKEARNTSLYELFVLALSTGMRRGEIIGLMWDDVDLNTGAINIQRQISVAYGTKDITPPKTMKSNRVVVVPKNVIDILKDYRNRNDSKWLFPSPRDNNEPIYPQTVYITLQRILKKIDRQHIRFHDLRHTFATMSLANGMNVKTLAEILGHTSVKTTLDIYSHMVDDMQKQAAEKIEKEIAGIKPITTRKTQRKAGTGTITKITEDLYEGMYSPRNAYGKKISRKVYATSRDECEVLLAKLVEETKAEISAEKESIKFEQSM